MNCLWCGHPFKPGRRRGSHPRKFCCAAHQQAFWSAARRWVAMAVGSGLLLSVENLKACSGAVHGKETDNHGQAGRAA